MTGDTLQQDIWAIFASSYPYKPDEVRQEVYKAVQKFREQIEAMKEEHMFLDGYKGACIDVLALVGEQKLGAKENAGKPAKSIRQIQNMIMRVERDLDNAVLDDGDWYAQRRDILRNAIMYLGDHRK